VRGTAIEEAWLVVRSLVDLTWSRYTKFCEVYGTVPGHKNSSHWLSLLHGNVSLLSSVGAQETTKGILSR
jgi:hypothetical protein